jgi:PA domain-containing protein/flagellar hook capping protein FlgD
VTGNLVLAQDGSLPPNSPTNACEPLTNAAAIAGNIALVDRGTCAFTIKVKNAQNAGAIAVVVADTMPGCPPLGMSGVDPTITIPTVRITTDDAATIKSQLALGVNVTMWFDPTQDAGTKEGKVLVYTPTVLATGSSVSHYDISADPSLLMEPFSTAGLWSSTDLTVNQFMDIGWFGLPGPCHLVDVPPIRVAAGASMSPPSPNPSALGATIGFRIAQPEYVRISILDVSGRAIRTVHEGMLPSGDHSLRWDGLTKVGTKVPPGVYLVSLRTSTGVQTQRIAIER